MPLLQIKLTPEGSNFVKIYDLFFFNKNTVHSHPLSLKFQCADTSYTDFTYMKLPMLMDPRVYTTEHPIVCWSCILL